MKPFSKFKRIPDLEFWVAACFLVLVFLLGGGSRADVLSLIILRPLAAGAMLYGLLTLTREEARPHRILFHFLLLTALLLLLHLVPLPYALWSRLPGHELLVQIGQAAELGPVWRPLTLNPPGGWNAFLSLVVPFAALLLAVRLSNAAHLRLILWIVTIGFVSILLGILQLQGPPNGPLYLYRITNDGTLVGLFSNRNHHAMFLATLFPMFAYLASRDTKNRRTSTFQKAMAATGALFVLAALAVNGSRGGFVLGLVGLSIAILLFRGPAVLGRLHDDKRKARASVPFLWKAGAAGLLVLVGLAMFTIPTSGTLDRILQTDAGDESRLLIWNIVPEMAWQYFPFGSGAGSFVEAFKIAEPMDDLGFRYVNHAHNDWLEVFLTFGFPGLLLLSGAVACWLVGVRGIFAQRGRRSDAITLGYLGIATTGLLALGSVVDYPLRTPSLACLFVFASVWMARGYSGSRILLGKVSR